MVFASGAGDNRDRTASENDTLMPSDFVEVTLIPADQTAQQTARSSQRKPPGLAGAVPNDMPEKRWTHLARGGGSIRFDCRLERLGCTALEAPTAT